MLTPSPRPPPKLLAIRTATSGGVVSLNLSCPPLGQGQWLGHPSPPAQPAPATPPPPVNQPQPQKLDARAMAARAHTLAGSGASRAAVGPGTRHVFAPRDSLSLHVDVAAAVPFHPQVVAVRSYRAFFESQIEEDTEEENEGSAARFFSELLGSDAALRGFYEAERDKGHFMCLVCEGSGARQGKRFAGCAALVQHARSIARTKRRLAHRAFAGSVGLLLGWGAGRIAPPPADSDSDGSSDQVGSSQIVEMELS